MILKESEKNRIRKMHREYSTIKENKSLDIPKLSMDWVKRNIVSQKDFDKLNSTFAMVGKDLMKEIQNLGGDISKNIQDYLKNDKKINTTKPPKEGGFEITSNTFLFQ